MVLPSSSTSGPENSRMSMSLITKLIMQEVTKRKNEDPQFNSSIMLATFNSEFCALKAENDFSTQF